MGLYSFSDRIILRGAVAVCVGQNRVLPSSKWARNRNSQTLVYSVQLDGLS